MATISTDTYLDGGTARTAGETWTINGCTLTIRTDTRWHANAPASMTGSLGTMTPSTALGGSIKIDATKVRWMPYNSGSGNVPAIGTTVSQGGVSGYLLGVWADIQAAPTAVGAAMPASGFIKFREVTGGTFSAGALTGIGASATGPDVVGWIEVCLDQSANFATNIQGGGLVTIGDWFEIGTTNGSRGQILNTPINGGGANSFVYGVQIETAPGSGVYEWYPTAHQTLGAATWSTTNYTTDARAKFVEAMASGQIRIGSNGSVDIGYLPPSGCKVRIPNIIGRTVATASRATNQTPGAVTRAGLTGGNYNIQHVGADWAFTTINATPKFTVKNSTFESRIVCQDNTDPVIIDNVCVGGFTGGTSIELTLTRVNNSTISNSKFVHTGSISGVIGCTSIDGVTFTNCEAIIFKTRTAILRTAVFTSCYNFTVNGMKVKGGSISLANSSNGTLTNIDYIDRLEGNTTSANASPAIEASASANFTISGLTFGEGGTIDNTQCYSAIINLGGNNSNFKVRNFGTRVSPLNCGNNASFYPANIISFNTTDVNCKFQRLFVTAVRGSIIAPLNNNIVGLLVEDVYSGVNTALSVPYGVNAIYRKVAGSGSTAGSSANNVVGVHWQDSFTSDTAGWIRWWGAKPSAATQDKNYITATPSQGTGYVSTGGAISLDTVGDYAISESDWMFLGHTSFQNSAPTLSGATTGLVLYYDIDNGSGFRNTWTLATGANLSAETISPSGFKMRIKIEQTSASGTASAITWIQFLTNSTQAAQANNQYPLDTNTLSFTGLATGSEVRCYVGTDPATAVEIGGTEGTAGSTFSFSHNYGGQAGYIVILAMGYQPVRFDYTYKTSDDSILIQPVVDRNYSNPA